MDIKCSIKNFEVDMLETEIKQLFEKEIQKKLNLIKELIIKN